MRNTRSRHLLLRKERRRILIKKWDGVVRTLLHEIARATWHNHEYERTPNRTVGQEADLFGIHWETHTEGVEGAYYRATLMTDENFSPVQFVVECRDKNREMNGRIMVSVSVESIKIALLYAFQSGPALPGATFGTVRVWP